MTILFVVESPGKVAKISKFLGQDYIVKASVGHFRDLDPKSMSIDFDNNFEPIYIVTKPDVVKNLKSAMKNADMLYIATDKDIEGWGIAQHIYDVLKPKQYKRLVFSAITKSDIMAAIKNAGPIDKNLVNAQKTRRVLDRLYGYLISPILQKQIAGATSAGRVQSVAVELVIDKENEIKDFLEKNADSTYFRVGGKFSGLKASLHEAAEPDAEAAYDGKVCYLPADIKCAKNTKVIQFLKNCLKSEFVVHAVFDKISVRKPAPPFETSTLQQEAHRKFGMSPDATMKTAQKLYEGGYITYMRTDSVQISEEGMKDIKQVVIAEYGEEYYQRTAYQTKSANAQEAHEAIRPTHADLLTVESEVDDQSQIKLYKLIWQRTIASQMKPAKINISTIQIDISAYADSDPLYYFQSQIEKVIFLGFMKVYVESVDDEVETDVMTDFSGKIPKIGAKLLMEEIVAKQEYKKPPARYSEASMIKTLKSKGLGRPSTYANTIKTIMDRAYVKTDNIMGTKKDILTYTIKPENKKNGKINEAAGTVLLGKENKKIVPTPLGINVNDFLVENFPEMMDYKFTAKMEAELDGVATGEKVWHQVIKKFYDRLNPIVEQLAKKKGISKQPERLLGTDADGNEIFATTTKYGHVVKKLIGDDVVYANIPNHLNADQIKKSDAIKLLEYPKKLGIHEANEIQLCKGQYGFYLSYKNTNYSLPTDTDPVDLDLESAVKIINAKQSAIIKQFTLTKNKTKFNANILNGPYGPYIQCISGKKRSNYRISKDLDPNKLTEAQVMDIISKKPAAGSKTAKKPAKSTKKPANQPAKKPAKKPAN